MNCSSDACSLLFSRYTAIISPSSANDFPELALARASNIFHGRLCRHKTGSRRLTPVSCTSALICQIPFERYREGGGELPFIPMARMEEVVPVRSGMVWQLPLRCISWHVLTEFAETPTPTPWPTSSMSALRSISGNFRPLGMCARLRVCASVCLGDWSVGVTLQADVW